MVATWVLWTVVGFMFVVGGFIITPFAVWFAYQRGSGEWGGGKDFFDFTPLSGGVGSVRKLKVFKRGSMYIADKGGDDAVMQRKVGMFKEEAMPVRKSELVPVGDTFFYGRKEIQEAFGEYQQNLQEVVNHLRNSLSFAKNQLQKESYEKEELVDYITEQLANAAKAVNYGQHKKGNRRSN